MDKYQDVRRIPLGPVLASLGFTGFKKRADKQEWYGKCPFHDAKKNKPPFSFGERRFNCFSCSEHGSGAIDLVMKLKKIGFQEAVNQLKPTTILQISTEKAKPRISAEQEKTESPGILLENKPFAGSYEKFM